MKLKFGSVCAGIGGFDQGFELKVLADGTVLDQKDSPRYRQLWNAVTMVVARWIGERTRKALDELRQE